MKSSFRRRTLAVFWFAAVAVHALQGGAQADDIEPEPYVEEDLEPEPEVEAEVEEETETAAAASNGPSVGSKIYDCVILRPMGLAATVLGAAIFVPVGILASPSGAENIEAAWKIFVVAQVQYTFTRPLGEF